MRYETLPPDDDGPFQPFFELIGPDTPDAPPCVTLVEWDEVFERIAPGMTFPCHCGVPLTIAVEDRGTENTRVICTHGTGEARYVLRKADDRNVWIFWTLGLCNPIGEWIDRLHAYEGRQG